ncbi:hypothetical protein PR048_007235 [Dryococelus australis]|uniref:DUF659 domain-containing protein n=1 Tax=Dryococelus australis TaxID=614101 RepID=A0ABQ9ID03_9NEOP|nr:hypothetical protein PR048_007235 [Dryococelus australis]
MIEGEGEWSSERGGSGGGWERGQNGRERGLMVEGEGEDGRGRAGGRSREMERKFEGEVKMVLIEEAYPISHFNFGFGRYSNCAGSEGKLCPKNWRGSFHSIKGGFEKQEIIGERVFVGVIKKMENANGSERSRAILSVVAQQEIKYENVVAVVSDSACFTTKCMDSLRLYFPKAWFVFSSEHTNLINIVASLWSVALPQLNSCVQNAKQAFLNTRKRKHRCVSFLKEKYPGYLGDLIEFFQQAEVEGSAANCIRNLRITECDTVK